MRLLALLLALWTGPGVALAQSDLDAHLARGRIEWRARRYTESAASYRRATRIAPDDARAFAGLARAYAALGAHRLAAAAYARAIALAPEPPAALHVAHGESLAAMGDREGASRAYAEAVRIDPANEAARAYPARDSRLRVALAEPANGTALVAGGVPLAVVGLVTAVGCGIAYALEPEGGGTGRAGTDPVTWVGCIGAGTLLLTGGGVLLGVGLAQGVGGSPASVRAGVSIGPNGAGAELRVAF